MFNVHSDEFRPFHGYNELTAICLKVQVKFMYNADYAVTIALQASFLHIIAENRWMRSFREPFPKRAHAPLGHVHALLIQRADPVFVLLRA